MRISTVDPTRFSTFRRFSLTAGLVGASVLGLAGTAMAQTTTTTTGSSTMATPGTRHSPLTTEQQACMTAKGFAPKAKPAAGTVKTPKTEAERTAERTAFEAAAKACGITLPVGGRGGHGPEGKGGHGPALTTEQQTCLTAKGITRPAAPAAGSTATRPAAPTAEQRAAFEAAAKSCGITLPAAGAPGDHKGPGDEGRGGHGGRHGGRSQGATGSTAAPVKA